MEPPLSRCRTSPGQDVCCLTHNSWNINFPERHQMLKGPKQEYLFLSRHASCEWRGGELLEQGEPFSIPRHLCDPQPKGVSPHSAPSCHLSLLLNRRDADILNKFRQSPIINCLLPWLGVAFFNNDLETQALYM